jgi:hypothetical protein
MTYLPPRSMCPLEIETILYYKHIDPPGGMWGSIHYVFTTKDMYPLGI